MKKPTVLYKCIMSLFLIVCAVITLLPIGLQLTNSLMKEKEISQNYELLGKMPDAGSGATDPFVNLKIIPDWVSFEQYEKVLLETPLFLNMFWNSVFLVVPIVVGQTVVGALAAYAFSKLKFRGREALFFVYLMTMLMPFQVTLVPNYIIIDLLGIGNSASAIILPGIFSAFGVFMMRQFMLAIPYAFVEAAVMDGAGHWYIFWRIIVPLMKPGIAALAILLFVDYWNMVEQPLIFLEDAFKQPLSLYLSRIQEAEKGVGFAASVLYMSPMVLLFLYAESYFVQGVQLSGIKG